jgi:hypothetical protein
METNGSYRNSMTYSIWFLDCTSLCVHAKNFDAGWGEHLLKDFFKRYASRSQERGRDIFISQVAKRAQEKILLDKALLCSSMATNFAPEKRTASIVNTLPAKPSFVL